MNFSALKATLMGLGNTPNLRTRQRVHVLQDNIEAPTPTPPPRPISTRGRPMSSAPPPQPRVVLRPPMSRPPPPRPQTAPRRPGPPASRVPGAHLPEAGRIHETDTERVAAAQNAPTRWLRRVAIGAFLVTIAALGVSLLALLYADHYAPRPDVHRGIDTWQPSPDAAIVATPPVVSVTQTAPRSP